MAWGTFFKPTNLDQPLFGDLENDLLFGRATLATASAKTLVVKKGSTTAVQEVFRGDFTSKAGEILGGTVRSMAHATNGVIAWTVTGMASNDVLDLLDRASHLDPVGDTGANLGLNALVFNGNDRLDDQSTGASTLNGYALQDTLLGNAGNDSLDGGSGFDQMRGGDGNDIYVVDNVSDSVIENAGEGVDKVETTISYTLPDAVENLLIVATASGINGFGNSLENVITGGSGDNRLWGRRDNDTLSGGSGDDTLEGGLGADDLTGGAGSDTASYYHAKTGVTVSLALGTATGGAGSDTLASIENLIGGQFNDSLTGDGGANVIEGGRGNDTMDGGGGNDTASFAAARSAVNASLTGATGTTTGTDVLSNFENLTGSSFNDTLTGDAFANVLNGKLGNDSLTGGGGADQFVFEWDPLESTCRHASLSIL